MEDLGRFGKLLQFRVYGILGYPVDSAGLLLSRAHLVSACIFFSLCTLAITAPTVLALLTQTDAERASIIISLEML